MMIQTLKRERKRMVFTILVLFLPLVQFAIFYVGVNFNQILMSFQEFSTETREYTFLSDIFQNYKEVLTDLKTKPALISSLGNSIAVCVASLIGGTTIALIFSSYIAHKRALSSFFRVMLFLPHIVSMVTLVVIFQYINDTAVPEIVRFLTGEKIKSILNVKNTERFYVILSFSVCIALGLQVLTYSGTMSGISESIIDAVKVDGFGTVQEFIYITVPMIWPTIVTFVTVTLSGFFVAQANLFSFFGKSANPGEYTYGYYMYSMVQSGTETNDFSNFPELSAMGILFTLIITPFVFIVRKLLTKYGPRVD